MDDNRITYARYGDSAEESSGWFAAPASEALGGEIKIIVLSEDVGGTGGQVKSLAATAVRAIHDYFLSHTTVDLKQAISSAIFEANTAIQKEKTSSDSEQGGASVSVGVIAADRFFLGSVGHTRTYVIRDDDIRLISLNKGWVREAVESWDASAEEIHDYDLRPEEYLGKAETVTPDIAPVEFIWPGDILLFLTSRLASRLRENQIRDIAIMNEPDQAAVKLVNAASRNSAGAELTALVIHAEGSAPVVAKPVLPISRSLRALVAVNAALLCVIAALFFRTGGLQNVFAPSPTVEVARPVFVQTPVFAPPGPDVGQDLSVPTPNKPAAAPTVAAVATFTPIPTPSGWQIPSAPPLLQPANASTFNGLDAPVILSWEPVNGMLDDMFYVVDIRRFVNGRLSGESKNWTKSTRIRLDSTFYTAMNADPSHAGVAAPLPQQAQVVGFEWSVSVYRLTSINPDGTLTGQQVTQPSPSRTFFWGPVVQQAPTRVYGSQSLETDPFFEEQSARASSSQPLLSSATAGMAGLWTLLAVLVSIPKAKNILRRYARRRFRL